VRSDNIKLGIEHAPHRALLKATGVTDADMSKPFIAVVNSYVDVVPGHVHLQEFGKFVKAAIRAAGGVPFEFNTIGVDDGIAMGHGGMKYSLPSRELIADCVETMLEAHQFDGMVCIPNCDKIVPGMLMAAMRLDIPAIFVSGGPMPAGRTPDGEVVDLISVFEGVGAYQTGKIDARRLKMLEDFACPACGSCSGMFTANSMNCLMEAIGLALPFNGSALALTAEREELAKSAWTDAEWKEATGVPAFWGEKEYLLHERIGARPTLEINGFVSGFYGAGSKTVLPGKALAKISCRLVANQNADQIFGLVRDHILRLAPPTVRVEVRQLASAGPALMDLNSPYMAAASRAYEKGWGQKPVYERGGGTLPILADFQRELNQIPIMLMGFGLQTDGAHGPNEHFVLEMFKRGIDTAICFFDEVGQIK